MRFGKLTLSALLPACALATLALSIPAHAQISSVGNFTGSETETFESFPTYTANPSIFQAEPVSIFGGGATLTSGHADIAIYSPSSGATFGLLSNGNAQVADGVNAAGLNSTDTATFTFATDVTQFGGYFGAASLTGLAAPITFSFFDDSNTLIGTQVYNYDHTATGDGILDFVGYASTANVKTITVSGDYIVFDGLQANAVAVPEPGSVALLVGMSLSGAGFLARRRKNARLAA